jgi:hypothetical protein
MAVRRVRKSLLALVATIVLLGSVAPAGADDPIRFFRLTDSRSDEFLADPSPDGEAWLRAHYWRMAVFSPYFDPRLPWFPDAWTFKDFYAIYPGSALATEHPDWIVRDATGRQLYIPYHCGRGRCPQYAADVGNPEFRARWIAEAVAMVGAGYRGLFVSDVSLEPRFTDGVHRSVRAIDPRTGRAMAAADWSRYVADFCAAIRAALPGIEIVHDTLWVVDDDDPNVQREIASADFLFFQHGLNDRTIRRRSGPLGLDALFAHADAVHARGKGIVFEGSGRTPAELEYNLAGHLLLDAGRDAVGSDRGNGPSRWWAGYDVSLGDPAGDRYAWRGLLRRDFAGGMVLLNAPGSPARGVPLPGTFVDLRGHARTAIRLGAARGAVLRAQAAAP